MESILQKNEPAIEALEDHIQDLSGASPEEIGKLYEMAGLGSKNGDFETQVQALIELVNTQMPEIEKELKNNTVEQVLNASAAGGRKKTRRARRRSFRVQHGGFLRRLLVGILLALEAIGRPAAASTAVVPRGKFNINVKNYLNHGESPVGLPNINVCAAPNANCGKYPRYLMPQIKNIDAFISRAVAAGYPLSYTRETRTIDEIEPSQSEALHKRINSVINGFKTGSLKRDKNPIIISNDGKVIDGHHRYFALRKLGDRGSFPVVVINATGDDVLRIAEKIDMPRAPRNGWSGLNPASAKD
jgi:hypothetical protein